MSDGGGETVSDAVICPFFPELNVPAVWTGPATVVLFWALGLAPPLFTHTYVADASAESTKSTFWFVPRPASLNDTVTVPSAFRLPATRTKCGLSALAAGTPNIRAARNVPSTTRTFRI